MLVKAKAEHTQRVNYTHYFLIRKVFLKKQIQGLQGAIECDKAVASGIYLSGGIRHL